MTADTPVSGKRGKRLASRRAKQACPGSRYDGEGGDSLDQTTREEKGGGEEETVEGGPRQKSPFHKGIRAGVWGDDTKETRDVK